MKLSNIDLLFFNQWVAGPALRIIDNQPGAAAFSVFGESAKFVLFFELPFVRSIVPSI